jgi:hypothetical protein
MRSRPSGFNNGGGARAAELILVPLRRVLPPEVGCLFESIVLLDPFLPQPVNLAAVTLTHTVAAVRGLGPADRCYRTTDHATSDTTALLKVLGPT